MTKPRKRQRAECLGFCQLRSLGAKEAPVADKRISKMREGKALISALGCSFRGVLVPPNLVGRRPGWPAPSATSRWRRLEGIGRQSSRATRV